MTQFSQNGQNGQNGQTDLSWACVTRDRALSAASRRRDLISATAKDNFAARRDTLARLRRCVLRPPSRSGFCICRRSRLRDGYQPAHHGL